MGCFSGALDRVGGTHRESWGSAFCGLMPIGLAVMTLDALSVWAVFARLPGLEQKILPLFLVFCSTMAAVGVLGKQRSIQLARVSYYFNSLILVLCIFAVILFSVVLFVSLFVRRDWGGCCNGHGDFATIYVTLLVAYFWHLPMRMSLYKILEAGGTGWEFLSAEELAILSKAKSIEEGIRHPLLGVPHQSPLV